MKRPKKLDPIAIRLDPETKDALEKLAKADDRSISDYARRVLVRHVEEATNKSASRKR